MVNGFLFSSGISNEVNIIIITCNKQAQQHTLFYNQ